MILSALEINDTGLTLLRDGAEPLVSPGVAVIEDRQLLLGDDAMKQLRLKPGKVNSRFWELPLGLGLVHRVKAGVTNEGIRDTVAPDVPQGSLSHTGNNLSALAPNEFSFLEFRYHQPVHVYIKMQKLSAGSRET